MDDTFQKILSIAEQSFLKSVAAISKLRINLKDRQQVYSACCYCRILELAGDAFHLIKSKKPTAVPIILRSMLEALATGAATLRLGQGGICAS